jgi:hypothetical protein
MTKNPKIQNEILEQVVFVCFDQENFELYKNS